jgi:hypothetical protein
MDARGEFSELFMAPTQKCLWRELLEILKA